MTRKAFTLFELIIVVILIGIIYAVVLTNFQVKRDVKIMHLKNIRSSLMPFWKRGKRVDLVIYDHCKKAVILLNHEPQKAYHPKINLKEFQHLKRFEINADNELKEIAWTSYRIDDKLYPVCFSYTIFKNGSNSSYILQTEDETYAVVYPYFQDINITEDEEEAKKLYLHEDEKGAIIDTLQTE